MKTNNLKNHEKYCKSRTTYKKSWLYKLFKIIPKKELERRRKIKENNRKYWRENGI